MFGDSETASLFFADNRLDPSLDVSIKGGYRDVLTLVDVNGHIAELQFTLQDLVEIKEEGGGHKVYEDGRVVQAFDRRTYQFIGGPSVDVAKRIKLGMLKDVAMLSTEEPASEAPGEPSPEAGSG